MNEVKRWARNIRATYANTMTAHTIAYGIYFIRKKYECTEYDCFLNYEGSCKGDFYDVCQLCTDLTEKEEIDE